MSFLQRYKMWYNSTSQTDNTVVSFQRIRRLLRNFRYWLFISLSLSAIYEMYCRGRGGFNAAPLPAPTICHGWRISLPRQDLLGEERWPILSKEKGPEPFPPWAFSRFICIGMQINLINHCQPVRVKQYMIYREFWGLILSYSQLVRGP